ncbi:MAG TPA: hypothetical protein VET24_13895 [Actinomycetota bacterium]|nr:hypothetical protein [Actinomycetota bacterium]
MTDEAPAAPEHASLDELEEETEELEKMEEQLAEELGPDPGQAAAGEAPASA